MESGLWFRPPHTSEWEGQDHVVQERRKEKMMGWEEEEALCIAWAFYGACVLFDISFGGKSFPRSAGPHLVDGIETGVLQQIKGGKVRIGR